MTRQPTTKRPGDVELSCPICSRPARNPHRWKELYSALVCPKCRNGFANRRQAAYLIDALLWHFAGAPLILYLVALPFEWVDIPLLAFSTSLLLVNWVGLPLLFFCKDGFRGMSPGKALFGVQVVDHKSREPIGFGRSLQRNLPLLIPAVGFLGIIWTMMNGRRWGDN